MTVSRWVSRWIDLRAAALAPRTVESYRSLLALHIAPTIGDRKLKSLKSKHISALLADLVARILLNPIELPIGVVTSLVGALAFIVIFYQTRKR